MFFAAVPLCLLYMTLAFLYAKKKEHFSLVDVFWTLLLPLLATTYVLAQRTLPGLVLLILVWLWGVRLSLHLYLRLKSFYPKEDNRYLTLRNAWKNNLNTRFFVFFHFQGIAAWILSWPFFLIASQEELSPLFVIGASILLLSILGEALSDWQLKQFVKMPTNKGKVCNQGLWNYSRHPNYFFEWCCWISYFLMALASPKGWTAAVSPLLMTYFLFKVTGIPAAEAQSLNSKGDLYREYQRTTSAFFPWVKKT